MLVTTPIVDSATLFDLLLAIEGLKSQFKRTHADLTSAAASLLINCTPSVGGSRLIRLRDVATCSVDLLPKTSAIT
jgi:hypothetical protein